MNKLHRTFNENGQIVLVCINAVAAAGYIICWILVVPAGRFFGSFWLGMLATVLGVVFLVLWVRAIIQTVSLWREAGIPPIRRMLVTILVLVSTGLAVGFDPRVSVCLAGE